MGRPKLTLDLGGKSVLTRLVDALSLPEIVERAIVIRKGDDDLARLAQSLSGLTIVRPEVDPPDMRASVTCALNEIRERFAPSAADGWLLVPADHPCLNQRVLRKLLDAWTRDRPKILVPTHDGKRGHPTLFRWSLAAEIDRLPPDTGLNLLLRQHADDVVELECDEPGILTDLDTPEDYDRLRSEFT